MREETFKRMLISQANIQPDMKVLDLGCGTGILTLMIKRAHPEANVTGLDGNPQVLKIAREKFHGLHIQWDEGLAPSRILIPLLTEWLPVFLFITLPETTSAAHLKRCIACSNRTANDIS